MAASSRRSRLPLLKFGASVLFDAGVTDLLSQTLEEEKQTDLKLTEVTQKAMMPEALSGDEEEGGGERGGSRSGGKRKAA